MLNKNILVVDDETSLLLVIERSLKKRGYVVKTFDNCSDALEALKTTQFQLLITDLKMPDMNGLDLIDIIKSTYPNTEIVVMTGYATVDTAIKALRNGVCDYILKPFNIQDIFKVVDKTFHIIELKSNLVSLQELNNFKDEFIRNISHEFKNPLMAISSAIEVISIVKNDPEKLDHMLGVINRQTHRLISLIHTLLDVSRANITEIQLDKHPISIVKLLYDAIEDIKYLSNDKQIKINYKFDENNQNIVICDYEQIKRVLINLLSNAIKFSPNNSEIEISFEIKNEEVIFVIKDNGFGIPKETINNLFNRFYRIDNYNTKNIPGIGLGLYVSKKIVEAHGGRIWAISEGDNKGSTFSFSLPLSL